MAPQNDPLLLTLNGIAVFLLLTIVVAWGRHPGRRTIAFGGILAAATTALLYFSQVRAENIPVRWLTVLTYGSDETSILQLYAQGAHAGGNFSSVAAFLCGQAALTLRGVVRMNLGLGLLNAVIFFALATYMQGALWAIPWTLAFALNAATFTATFSELPACLLTLYFLTGTIAWVTLNDSEEQPWWIRTSALALLSLLTLFIKDTRTELALIGAVALGVWTVHSAVGETAWAAFAERAGAALKGPLSFLSRHPGLIALLCFAGIVLSMVGSYSDTVRWVVSAVYPFNPQFLVVFAMLPMLALPLAVSAAALAGGVYAALHFRRFGGVALSLAIVINMYIASKDGFYEMVRHTSAFISLVFVLALFGRQMLDEISRRWSWRASWRQLAIVLYVMAWVTEPLPGSLNQFIRADFDPHRGFSEILLARNTQREVRFLVSQTEQNPQCIFIARTIRGHADPSVQPQWEYVLFGKPVADRPLIVDDIERGLDTISRQSGAPPCVRLFYGEDCNLAYSDRCRGFVTGRQIIDEERFWSQPYNEPRERGFAGPEIVLATYRW